MTNGAARPFIQAMDHANNTNIWVLLDDRAGNRSQCLGVVNALNMPFEVRELSYSALAGLPNMIKGASFMGLTDDTVQALRPPWPDLVIAAGRRTASAARAIKRRSGGTAKIIQIMYPGTRGADEFDLIAVPGHDRPRSGGNLLIVAGAPHGLTPEVLHEAHQKWMPGFAELPGPRIAVFAGGSTRHRTFTEDMARGLGRAVNTLAKDAGGSLMVSTSRRTGQAATAVMGEITVPHVSYHWGGPGDNPYQGYLACADATVVSGDSVSMCSEACAGTSPVYIYAPSGFVVDKHARLHQTLYAGGYARPLNPGEAYSEWTHAPLNAASEIADAIRTMLEPS